MPSSQYLSDKHHYILAGLVLAASVHKEREQLTLQWHLEQQGLVGMTWPKKQRQAYEKIERSRVRNNA